jgi:two-component system NtrC family sensor kinase
VSDTRAEPRRPSDPDLQAGGPKVDALRAPLPPFTPLPRRFWPWRSALLAAFIALSAAGAVLWALHARDAALDAVRARAPEAAEWIDALRAQFDAVIAVLGAALVLGTLALAVLVRRRLWAFRAEETDQYVIAIRREGAKWKALTESAADAIVIVDPRDGTIRERNRQAAALLGDAPLANCLSREGFDELKRSMDDAIAQPGRAIAARELRARAADGAERILDVRMAGIDLVDERVVELSLRDVTRERAMERQLAIAERLSSLGLLTAGVAHEINNPLEGIGNYLSLLDRPTITPEQRTRYVGEVRHGFERIRDIVRDLLSFARPGVEQGQADLAVSIDRVSKLVGYTKAFEGVEIALEGLATPIAVAAERGRLEQVLLNLMMNAATAMDGRGRVTLRARRFERAGERWARIEVCDQGPGIAAENLSRIFDPFFTTTQGNGLGLSISYGLVRAHGGELRAANQPGGGAIFTIELPEAH